MTQTLSDDQTIVPADIEIIGDPTTMRVRKRDGSLEPVDAQKIVRAVSRCADNLGHVDVLRVATRTISGLYDGATTEELDRLSIQTAASLISEEPEYSRLASRLLSKYVDKEVRNQDIHSFSQSISQAHQLGLLNDDIAQFVSTNARKLNDAVELERTRLFEFFGLRTVYDRYLLRHPQTRKVIESPQYFFLRVACGLSENASEAVDFYQLISSLDYLPSTPTLFNSGTRHTQMSSCYLLDSPSDSLDGIYKRYHDIARLSKHAGGIGVAWTRVRSRGSLIQGTNGLSNGIVPWLKTLDSSVAAVNQGGKRKGAACVYLETWHADIEEFLELRDNTGDDARRTHNLNLANWVPDLFMRRVSQDAMWSLFDPKAVPQLTDTYGDEFERIYTEAEERGDYVKQVKARDLYAAMMRSLAQTGNGWMTFKDAANRKANQTAQPGNVIHLSNLCTEILEVTSQDETAVCLAEGTQVLTSDGLVNIEDADGCDVYVPFASDEDFSAGGYFSRAVLMDNGIRDVLQIELTDGRVLEATPEHKFLVRTNRHKSGSPDVFVWRKVHELTEDDLLVDFHHESIVSDELELDRDWATIGWLVGDGWQRDDVYGACFAAEEDQARETVLKTLEEWHSQTEALPRSVYKNFPTVRVDRNGVYNWATERKQLIAYMQERFGLMPHLGPQKEFPDRLDWNDHRAVSSFLSGLFSADGHIGIDKEKSYVALTSSSRRLLLQTQMALKVFGVHGRIRWNKHADGRSWGLLNISGDSNLRHFADAIGFSLAPRKQEALDFYDASFDGFKGKRCTIAVKSVSSGEKRRVYDLALEDGHHFIAGGVVTHNCNLGSINVGAFVQDGDVDYERIGQVARKAITFLDRVIDLNWYPTPEAEASNKRWRPVGLGLMGLQDVFFKLHIPFDSPRAREISRRISEEIYFNALTASIALAEERGAHEAFPQTRAAQGLFQFDLWDVQPSDSKRWETLREKMKKHGLRNSLMIAIAPTATIASIAGCYECIEPQVSNLFKRETLSGEFLQINQYLVNDLKDLGMWDEQMRNKIKKAEGSVEDITEIPAELREIYRTTWEIPMRSLIDMAADRGAFIDQSQSLNLFMETPTIGKLSSMYMYGWEKGLKTTYYLRSRPATRINQTTIGAESGEENPTDEKTYTDAEAVACSLENPEACEVCQ